MLKNSIMLFAFAMATSCTVMCETAYFAFKTPRDTNEFIFKLTDDAKIKQARDILAGNPTDNQIHVLGRIKKTTASYNPNYSFTLDESYISFFAQAIEVCDASLTYTEDHLDEACGAFLPGCIYCPWESKLTREVKST